MSVFRNERDILCIETDYKCLYTQKNYAFYRIEDEKIQIVRILSEKRDFMYILLGIPMSEDKI